MTPSAAKALLKKENELLAELKKTADQFPLAPDEAAVLNGWSEYFGGWSMVNEELRQLGDNDFRQRIRDERKMLKDMSDAINDDTSTGKFYKDMLAKDITKAGQMET
jgi:hypothetical protein